MSEFLVSIFDLLKNAFGKNISVIPKPVLLSNPPVNLQIQPPVIQTVSKTNIEISLRPKYFKDVVARYGTPYDIKTQQEDESIKLQWEHDWMELWTSKKFTEVTGLEWPATGPFRKIYCNRDLIPYLNVAFKNLIERDLFKELKTFDGSWCIRKIRGSNDKWSMHTFALAVDFNQAENKLGEVGKFSEEFLQCWRDSGWTCGADFERRDFMHYQIVTNA